MRRFLVAYNLDRNGKYEWGNDYFELMEEARNDIANMVIFKLYLAKLNETEIENICIINLIEMEK